MDENLIKKAIKEVMLDCQARMKAENYESVSLRSILTKLGYTHDQTVDVIFYVAENGFNYCLDNIVSHKDANTGEVMFPDQRVCYWSPDQLKSRLYAVTPGVRLDV